MLDLQVVPEGSLGNEQWQFALGMPLFQAVQILQQNCRTIRNVDVIYNDKQPFESDLQLNLVNDGVRLLFESRSQRLKIIEIYDLSKTKLKYCGKCFNSPQIIPTKKLIDKTFGSTLPPHFDEKHHVSMLTFRGITFLFPVDKPYEANHGTRSQPDDSNLVLTKLSIYNGSNLADTSAPPMPLPCYHGNIYSECTDVLMSEGRCYGVQFKLVSEGEDNTTGLKLKTSIRCVRFDDTAQDVLSEIGNPCQTFYKLEDKMKIHSSRAHKMAPSDHSDYFYNYFTLGLDILFDGSTHKVKKFILHSNHPGHYNFNIYYRSEFKIDLQGVGGAFLISPDSPWDQVTEALGGPQVVGKPVVLNRSSSTNNTNPFGSTNCYGFENMIFEVMRNNYVASVTFYKPSIDNS
ncbi:phagosome assembly factor 1-like [Clavelina lepadiformis]|uniref:Uncharacterized protein n=1 Tax=Clavelina lepadiformis TaxID=159417 RepID=A0ABP0G896_CLALP